MIFIFYLLYLLCLVILPLFIKIKSLCFLWALGSGVVISFVMIFVPKKFALYMPKKIKYFLLREEDPDKKLSEYIHQISKKADIFPEKNTLTVDLPWEQFVEQLLETHKKKGIPTLWTIISLKLAEETNQGFVSIFFDELISIESPSDELLIFYVPSQFIGEQIQRVPHEKILKAVNTEFPEINEVRFEVKGGKI